METGRFDPEVAVSVDTPGLGARIEYEGEVYALVTGEIRAGTFGGDGDGGDTPGVLVDSRVQELDAPDRYEGESVAVMLDYGAKSVTFPALGRDGTDANPAAFSAVRGEPPAEKFSEYETAVKILKRGENV